MIGIFDSGFGGLTVLRHVRSALPHHDVVYFGDSGRTPYGGRDVHTILDFAEQATERLFEEGCRVVVVACHTVSCVALRHLQQRYAGPGSDKRILGVTIPAAEAAMAVTRGHVGLLATAATVRSNTYAAELAKLGSVQLSARAAPVLPPIVEEGWELSDTAREAVRAYLADLSGIDTLVLGCTHFPLLREVIAEVVEPGVHVLDPGPFVADRLVDWLKRHPGFDPGEGEGALRVLCSGDPGSFAAHGARFLGESLPLVHHVAEVDGRLAHRDPSEAPVGQVVRDRPRR
jgi:glutamate racemase